MSPRRGVERCVAAATAAAVAVLAGVGAVPVGAQRVMLEVRPRPGDTLRVILEHAMTISGGPRNAPDSMTSYSTTYHIETRDVVQTADANGTIVEAIVDSVGMRTTGSIGASPFPGLDRSMQGLRVRLLIASDGGSRIIDGLTQLDSELRVILGATPSVLPQTPVAVGESWTRELPVPSGGSTPGTGALRTTFKLDSLTDNGDRAWISLRGRVELKPDPSPREGTVVSRMTGTLAGTLLLDRRRGWLAESRANVTVESVVTLHAGAAPLLVTVRMNQVMRTAPPRR